MTAEVIRLDDYRERKDRPDFDEKRRQHLRERMADLAIEIALLDSEKQRLELLLKTDRPPSA